MIRTCVACQREFQTAHIRKATCDACAARCAICGGKHKANGLCSRHEMQRRRAGNPPVADFIAALQAGVDLGRAVRACCICGASFHPYSAEKTCSEACAQAHIRQRQRQAKRREWARRHDLLIQRQRQRYHSEAGQAYAKAVHKARWKKIKADPALRAAARQRAKATYRRHAQAIQARRRERLRQRLAAMTPQQLCDYLERLRNYVRQHRARVKADPQRYAQLQVYQARYRRLRARHKLAQEMLALLARKENL